MFFLKRRFTAVLVDLLTIPISWYSAYWLRFNARSIPQDDFLQALYILPFLIGIQFFSFSFFGLYRGIWGFASLPDFIRILKSVLVGVVCSVIVLFFFHFQTPRVVIPIYAWLLVSLLGGTRLLYRWYKQYYRAGFKEGKRVLVVGAGEAADLLIREVAKNVAINAYNIVAIVDDDLAKVGCELHGVRIVGVLDKIPDFIDQYDIELVIIAMPSAEAKTIRAVVDYCKDSKIEFRIVPRLSDLIVGNAAINTLREVSVEDLLGRDQVTLDWEAIAETIRGKNIFVTGGGGSIGSELCRQIAYLAPSLLVIVDNSEFNLYTIDKELREKFPTLHLVTCLIDIVDLVATQNVIKQYKPQIVFHAAAYKHVPLLEHQVRAAVRNNVLGTYNLAKVASDNSVATFVLISSDKAVNPVNIMGATKRAAEIICQNFNGRASTHFITVRFGNVLGSAGSVIPLFREQLAAGKDLTVTHPEVTRYFMTISEATQLILQATVLGKDGEIFVLDMGESIKIRTLAEHMIHLSGKKPGEDVNIVYIGLRPGEKLYEELFYNCEELLPTAHVKIKQAKYQTLPWDEISSYVAHFDQMCGSYEEEGKFKELLLKIVPEYKSTHS
ncbi:MAG TPA: polysaccharide biosynthesis protein [Coxiellaceae bacterium]|nr:polysaccharide biosynthesis protein [Coxiellaceae bacterium]